MAASQFIQNLRTRIGHELLHLIGISAVVLNDRQEILLVRSREHENWMPIGGMLEIGEEPADAAVREVLEETGVTVEIQHLAGVFDGPRVRYRNGDEVHYLTIVFRCHATDGSPRVADDENLDVKYFPANALPELRPDHLRNIQLALRDEPAAVFLKK